jgi:hypothetical protein
MTKKHLKDLFKIVQGCRNKQWSDIGYWENVSGLPFFQFDIKTKQPMSLPQFTRFKELTTARKSLCRFRRYKQNQIFWSKRYDQMRDWALAGPVGILP